MKRPSVFLVLMVVASLPLPVLSQGPGPAPRGEEAPEWAPGCSWTYAADEDVSFCMTVPSAGDLHITHVSGTQTLATVEDTVFNGTPSVRVEGSLSLTLKGTLVVFGIPLPVTFTVTGNSTEHYRDTDQATVNVFQHVLVDMGMYGSITMDTDTDCNPPQGTFRWPLEVPSSWEVSTDQMVWSRTTGSFGTYESTTVQQVRYTATLSRMEDVKVSAGTFACQNISNLGTRTAGSDVQAINETILYCPAASNLALREIEPLEGVTVRFGLRSFSLNRAPHLASAPPAVEFPEDTVGSSLDLSTLFTDPDGDELGFTFSNASNLSVAIDGSTGAVSFKPPADWSGREIVSFRARDPKGAECSTWVEVTVVPVNDPPALVTPLPGMMMDEDGRDASLDLSMHFSDVDLPYGDELGYSFFANGSVAVKVSRAGAVELAPHPDWNGFQNITFTAKDRDGREASGTLDIAVRSLPDPPVALFPTSQFTILEDEALHLELSERFADPDLPGGDRLSFSAGGLPSDFTLELLPNGSLTARPPADYTGTVRLALNATDTSGLSALEDAMVVVAPVNDPPVLTSLSPQAENLTLPENSSLSFSADARDVDSSRLTFRWLLDGSEVRGGREYTLVTDFASEGHHVVSVEVSDGALGAARRWGVTVTDVNRKPQDLRILSPLNGTKFTKGKVVAFTAEAKDPDRDELEFTWKDTDGRVLGRGASFETKNLTKGRHAITVEVSDGLETVSASVHVVINPAPASRTPGFEALPVFGAAALLLLGGRMRRKRRVGPARGAPWKGLSFG